MRLYLGEAARSAPMPSVRIGGNEGGPSTIPSALLPLERFVARGAQMAPRVQRVQRVLDTLEDEFPGQSQIVWLVFRCVCGPLRIEDPHELHGLTEGGGEAEAAFRAAEQAWGELVPLFRHTDAVKERARQAWPAWCQARKPWGTERALRQREHLAWLFQRELPKDDAKDENPLYAFGVLAAFGAVVAHIESPQEWNLLEVAVDVVERACAPASRNEALVRAMAHQADKMLSEASRVLETAWQPVAAAEALERRKQRQGDPKLRKALQAAKKKLGERKTKRTSLEEAAAVVAELAAWARRNGGSV
jgi:hypothetical protein